MSLRRRRLTAQLPCGVVLPCSDCDHCVAFYRDKLGFDDEVTPGMPGNAFVDAGKGSMFGVGSLLLVHRERREGQRLRRRRHHYCRENFESDSARCF